MAYNSQGQGLSQAEPSASNKTKTFTTIPRNWPQGPFKASSSNSTSSSHNQAQTPTDSVNTINKGQRQHTASPYERLPTPMDRWLTESTRESPFNNISSFKIPPNGYGRGQGAQGGETMERGNGGNKSYVGDNWSMERNEQSERWM